MKWDDDYDWDAPPMMHWLPSAHKRLNDADYFECRHCGFIVDGVEWRTILCNPVCRCGGYRWHDFKAVAAKPEPVAEGA